MARKRLSVFGTDPGEPLASAGSPIARVAGDAATIAALETVTGEFARARSEGRLAEPVPIVAIDTGHLVRDRVALDEEDLGALIESLRLHGQRVPVELVDLGQGRYGLISGWRRITALARLQAETGDPRFGQVLAILRRPPAAGAAYVAMVEENEIRAGLSYYERARIAARAVEAGAFPDRGDALRTLYAAASRAKRSKIGSFLTIVDALDGALRFPGAIPERLGLALAARLGAEPPLAARITADLAARPVATAEEEMARLTRLIRPATGAEAALRPASITPGIRLDATKGGGLVLTGPGVDADFRARLEQWLRDL